MPICGVYTITNRVNGKVYVGSSIDVHSRFAAHRAALKAGRHHSPHLQAAYVKDRLEAFSFAVVEACAREQLLSVEQKWMYSTRCADPSYGYNIVRFAGRPFFRRRHSPEAKQKMAAAFAQAQARGRRQFSITREDLDRRNSRRAAREMGAAHG